MSQKAIKKRSNDSCKSIMHIPVQPLADGNRSQQGHLPPNSFQLSKFIALPLGLRPKTSQNTAQEDRSPKKSTPVKAIAIPSVTYLSDSRTHAYMVGTTEGKNYDQTSSNNNFIGNGTVEHVNLPNEKSTSRNNIHVQQDFSTPNSPRGYYSAQNSPRASSPRGSVNSRYSNESDDSMFNKKHKYRKRSQSAPPGHNRKPLQDNTNIVLQKCNIPGLTSKHDLNSDGLSTKSVNWLSTCIGLSPTENLHKICQSNNISDTAGIDFNKHKTCSTYFTLDSEFSNVCAVNSFAEHKNVDHHNMSLQNAMIDKHRSTGEVTGINTTNNSSEWKNFSAVDYELDFADRHVFNEDNNFSRSSSDLNPHTIKMSAKPGISRDHMATGTSQTSVVHIPGGQNMTIQDSHGIPNFEHHFNTAGKTQGTLMRSKLKFSSMPTLVESKGDKKLLKILKKQEKEERKKREKEEKKRAKEEKKRLKLEKKLKIKTLPKSFQYTNGHILNPSMNSVYKRPMLSLSAVPIKDEDGKPIPNASTPAVKMVPPPLLGPSLKTMSMYASAPDLLRIEQVYGATLPRGIGKDWSRPALPSNYSPRTVVLQQASGGYGFVLRGIKSHTKPNGELDFQPTAQIPALQFLDSVEPGSIADRAGLRKGDFILEINGENVVWASHDRVVHLIRSTGSQLVLKVVGVQQGNQPEDMSVQKEKFMTMSNTKKKVQAPAPLKRDPRTSLSMTRSEGHYVGEEMVIMDTLDDTIQGKKDGGDIKIASIRSRTAAKRVSVVDMHNIGGEGTQEISKNTSDFFDENSKTKRTVIDATPVISGEKSSSQKNIYTVTHVNTTDTGIDTTSPTGIIRPKVPPPPPPVEIVSPKKQAPKPPSETIEGITVETGKPSSYALATNVTRPEKLESPFVSSFRPGASAKLSEDPIESKGYKQTDQHNTSADAAVVSKNSVVENGNPVSKKIISNSDEQNVFSIEDQVLDRAASFLKKHPNAKSLITREGLEKVKNRNSTYEPLPDYDSNIEDEAFSPVKARQNNRQSVTVISVGDKIDQTPQTKCYTIHSTIPSVNVHANYSLPTRPQGPAPSPLNETLWQPTKQSPVQNSPKQLQHITVKAEINMTPAMHSVALHETSAPLLSETVYPDYSSQESSYDFAAKVSSASREAPPPPPPPPPLPPPVPSVSDDPKLKAEVQAEYIPKITQDAVAAAVAKRQERLEKEGPKMGSAQKPKKQVEIPVKDPTQAAILAAVAKRREQLEQQSTTSVVESIESRLQKTKKLQAAKFQIANTKTPKDGDNDIEKSNLSSPRKAISSTSFNDIEKSDLPLPTRNAFSSAALHESGENISKEPLKVNENPAKEQTSSKSSMEISFQVKPLNIAKYQTGTKASKPAFASTAMTNYKTVNGLSSDNDKLKKQECVKHKAESVKNSIANVTQTKMEIENKSMINEVVSEGKNNNLNGLSSDSDKFKKQDHLKPKAEQLENSVAGIGQTKKESENKSSVNKLMSDGKNNNASEQADFLALAVKKRLEFLQRKQKSSESKSSSASGSPEINRFHTQTENKQPAQKGFSPQSLIKPKQNGFGATIHNALQSPQMYANVPQPPPGFRDGNMNRALQLEILPPPSNYSSDHGLNATLQHSPSFSPDTASLASSLSTLSSQSGDPNGGHTNTFEDDTIAPPPPGFGDSDMAVIPPPPEFGNEHRNFANRSVKTFIDKPVNDWMCNDVLDWLDSLKMSQYKSSFQSNCINGKTLLALTRSNYIDLGVAQVGHRMNIERSIKKAAIMQSGNSNETVTSEHL